MASSWPHITSTSSYLDKTWQLDHEEDWALCRVFCKDRGISARFYQENSFENRLCSSPPALIDTFLTFDQTPPSLEGFEQVPCFSNTFQNKTSQCTNPTFSSLPLEETNIPNNSIPESSVLPVLNSPLEPLSYEKEVIKAILDHLDKMESNSKMLEVVSPTLAQGSFLNYSSEMGLPSIWNECSFDVI